MDKFGQSCVNLSHNDMEPRNAPGKTPAILKGLPMLDGGCSFELGFSSSQVSDVVVFHVG